MTQDEINKVFQSDLGQQCTSLFVTSDNQPFIRYAEAINHSQYLNDTTINEWFPEN